jgi:hypothetical protein
MSEKMELDDAMQQFASYLNRQYDSMLSATGKYNSVIIKIKLSEEDCALLLKKLNISDEPKTIDIGNYSFEYIGQYRKEINTSPLLKIGGGIFNFNFYSEIEDLKKYIINNKFKIRTKEIKIKVLDIEKVEGRDASQLKQMDKLSIFKCRINQEDLLTSEHYCDQDGFIYISTDKPAFIYENFGVDNVLCVERIGSTFVIK